MPAVCPYCDKHIEVEDYDEYSSDQVKEGLAIPFDNLPQNKDEVHVWRGRNQNLFMHFTEGAN